MKILYLTIAFIIFIGNGAVAAERVIEASSPAGEEEYPDIEVFEEEPAGRDMYPYFSAGGRMWFSHMYDDDHHQGDLYMYGGEVNIDITEQFGIGGTFMVGKDDLSQSHRNVERKDLDVAIKYQFCRYLTGYLDFKRIDYDYTVTNDKDLPSNIQYQETLNGIGFGLASAVPILDTGLFVYLGGGFMPFIDFSSFDPLDPGAHTSIEKQVDYLYNTEGGMGYFFPTRYFDLMATIGYRVQVQRMVEHIGFTAQGIQTAGEENPSARQPGPKRVTEHSNLVQQGIICGLRINW